MSTELFRDKPGTLIMQVEHAIIFIIILALAIVTILIVFCALGLLFCCSKKMSVNLSKKNKLMKRDVFDNATSSSKELAKAQVTLRYLASHGDIDKYNTLSKSNNEYYIVNKQNQIERNYTTESMPAAPLMEAESMNIHDDLPDYQYPFHLLSDD